MSSSSLKTRNRLLWTAQVVVALVFAFAGVSKFLMPVAALQQGPIVFPVAFIHFIGACETLGALGLVLPGLTRIAPYLTSLAAAGLTIIMIGATTVSVMGFGVAAAALPAVIGVLTTVIAYGRARVVPLRFGSRSILRAA